MSTEITKRKAVTEVTKIAEELQDDCHKCVSEIIKGNPHLTYQDATNVWIFTKLAELQYQLNQTEEGF